MVARGSRSHKFHEVQRGYASQIFFLIFVILNLKYCSPDIGCCCLVAILAQFLGAKAKIHQLYTWRMSLDSAVDLMTPGFPFYQVFQGVGYAPTILVTSEPIPADTYSWQFLGKAPANMPVHQVVHSLQQTLATGETWTPYMVPWKHGVLTDRFSWIFDQQMTRLSEIHPEIFSTLAS